MAESIGEEGQSLESTTVQINRTATVVKGGRRFSFGALVVVGDRLGNVGQGYGKAPGVPAAIEKAQKEARKNIRSVKLQEGTIPHTIMSKYGASAIKLVPAAPGTGVIAGGTVRTVLELAGVRDCLTKSFGSNNQKNLVKATLRGLEQMRKRENVAELRGVEIDITDTEKQLEAGRRFAPTPVTTPKDTPKSTRSDGARNKGPGGRGSMPPKGKPRSKKPATVTVKPPADKQGADPPEPTPPSASDGTDPTKSSTDAPAPADPQPDPSPGP